MQGAAELDTDTSPETTVRELSPDEFARLSRVTPFDQLVLEIGEIDWRHTKMVVAETPAGEIVAYWLLFDAVHVEPVWIHPQHRTRVGLIRRLWRAVYQALQGSGVEGAFAICAEDGLSYQLAQRLGFRPMGGRLMYLVVDKAKRLQVRQAAERVEARGLRVV